MNQLSIKKMNEISKKKKKGFTLVELIIVIAIIAILAAIAIPKFGQMRENANKKADIATAKNIATVVAAELANDKDLTTAAVSASDDIGQQIDGGITPKSGDTTATSFTYNVDKDGNITVYYTGDSDTLLYGTASSSDETETETGE